MDPIIFSSFVRETFKTKDFIPLHQPVFKGNELKYLKETIDSTFVSSVGKYVESFEEKISNFLNVKKSIATVNGTSALHLSLFSIGVDINCEVITQALSFTATSNAIAYTGAKPIYIDVDLDTMGLSPLALSKFLNEFAEKREKGTFNKVTGKKIAAIVPMHTYGFMTRIDKIVNIGNKWGIPVLEDAAEALGSSYKKKFAGSFGLLNTFSLNGNKIITAGGGGIICTNDENIGHRVKHLSTAAKTPHKWNFYHNELGFNYRMPNVNAAIALAQIENFKKLIISKEKLFKKYSDFFSNTDFLVTPPPNSEWNYWLICLKLNDINERDFFLEKTNSLGIMTRPTWKLLYKLPMFENCQRDDQKNAQFLEDRIINIPSSAIL